VLPAPSPYHTEHLLTVSRLLNQSSSKQCCVTPRVFSSLTPSCCRVYVCSHITCETARRHCCLPSKLQTLAAKWQKVHSLSTTSAKPALSLRRFSVLTLFGSLQGFLCTFYLILIPGCRLIRRLGLFSWYFHAKSVFSVLTAFILFMFAGWPLSKSSQCTMVQGCRSKYFLSTLL